MTALTLLFLMIFVLNVVPAFAHPTWILFIAYGLTRALLWLLATPFFIDRTTSFGFAFEGGSVAFHHFGDMGGGIGVWVYFGVTQLVMLGMLYPFAKIDWRTTLAARRLRWFHQPLLRSAKPVR